jgi:hypothetical protein
VITALSDDEVMEHIAASLSELTGTGITVTDGGFRVKETPTHWVDVVRMIYNWRVARTSKDAPMTYDRHWCFAGTGWPSLIAAVLAAAEWDGGDDTDPAGWNKNGQTREWREPDTTDPRPA